MKKIITLTSAIVVNCCCFGMHETENNVYNTSYWKLQPILDALGSSTILDISTLRNALSPQKRLPDLPTLKEYQNLVLEKIKKGQGVNNDTFTVLWEITKAVNFVTLPNERHDNIFDFCQKFYPKIQSYNPNNLKNVLFAMLNAYPEKDRITFITGFMQAAKGKKDLFMYKHLLQAIKCEVTWELGQIQQPLLLNQTKLLDYFKGNANYSRNDLELMIQQGNIPEYTRFLLLEFFKISDCMCDDFSDYLKKTKYKIFIDKKIAIIREYLPFTRKQINILDDKQIAIICEYTDVIKYNNITSESFQNLQIIFRNIFHESESVYNQIINAIYKFNPTLATHIKNDTIPDTKTLKSRIFDFWTHGKKDIPSADYENSSDDEERASGSKTSSPRTIDPSDSDDDSSGDEYNEILNEATKFNETAKKIAKVQKKKKTKPKTKTKTKTKNMNPEHKWIEMVTLSAKETLLLTTKIELEVQQRLNEAEKNKKLITEYVNMLTNELRQPMSDESRIFAKTVIMNLVLKRESRQFYVILFAWKKNPQQLKSFINQVTCREHLKLLFLNVYYVLIGLSESQKKQLTEKRFSNEDLNKFSVFLKRPFETTEETTTN